MSHQAHAPPPPGPEIDPAATGAYGGYQHGSYAVESVQNPLPPLAEALHPNDNGHYAPPGTSYGTEHRESNGHAAYDQAQPSNFFETAHVDGQHVPAATAAGGAYGATSAIMTPPAGSTSHNVYSSPYQASTAPMFHRASISGPVMHSHYSTNMPTATAPSHSASTGDIWATQTIARPHTADGMFGAGQVGGMPAQWGLPAEYHANRGPRGSTSSALSDAQSAGNSKVFSYMSNGEDMSTTSSTGVGGNYSSGAPRKRPRRRFDEIERLYTCKWPGCQKSYGTLNHLNAHVAMQKHGSKRSPAEFKDMRKAWRKGKREEEQRRQANQAAANEEALARKGMMLGHQQGHGFMSNNGSSTSPSMGGSTGSFPSSASSSSFSGPSSMAPPPAGSMMGLGGAPGAQVPRYHSQTNAGMPGAAANAGAGAGNNFYSGGAGSQSSGGLGAYLMAHRGSI